ncbi:MAG: Rrf2 family protein [Lentimonas sp.]
MKLSRKLGYACRVLGQLALYNERGKLGHIDELAEIEEIPANYLVQILNELRNAGLITSKRGKQGGYALSRSPNQIGLEAIIMAVDSELLERKFEVKGHSGERVAGVWDDIGKAFEKTVRCYTLEAFMVRDRSIMYYI